MIQQQPAPTIVRRKCTHEVFVLRLLLLEQITVVVIGGVGALYAESASTIQVFFIGALILLNLYAISWVLSARLLWSVQHPSLALWLVIIVLTSSLTKLAFSGEPVVVLTDSFRIVAVMSAILLGTHLDTSELARLIRNRRRMISSLIMILCGVVILGRLRGWTNPFLAGDPIVGLLVLPAILPRTDDRKIPIATWLAAFALIGISLKRTAWLAVSLAIVCLVIRSVIRMRFRAVGKLAILGIVGILLLIATGAATPISNRISNTDLTGASDAAIAQRDDEVRLLMTKIRNDPVSTLTWGLSPSSLKLENGVNTHAIHNTPVFLLAYGGGVLVVFGVSTFGRRTRRVDFALMLGAIMGIADSLGGNTALNPSLGISIGILMACIRKAADRLK